MFLDATLAENSELVDAAVELHQTGQIGPNTFVLDIDRIVANSRKVTARAQELGLALHVMTKQQGRNPFMALAAMRGGIPTAVAVDVPEARILHLHGVSLGHVGHLVQVPRRDVDDVLAMGPGAITVFTIDAARRLSEAAAARGVVQDVLLRVWKPGDFIYPGQEGGIALDGVNEAATAIGRLPGVRIAGVTSFPCLLWDDAAKAVRPTGNLDSVAAAAAALRHFGLELTQINAPAVTAVSTLEMIAERGATHGEPGSSLTGSTPLHAAGGQPETPAMVYVSEITAVHDDQAHCFGGGFYARSRLSKALLVEYSGRRRTVAARRLPPEVIDYYGALDVPPGTRPQIGQTVIFAFRSQVFVGRCQVAAVSGLASGRLRLLGVCDQHGNVLGPDQLPVGSAQAREQVQAQWRRYEQEQVVDAGEVR